MKKLPKKLLYEETPKYNFIFAIRQATKPS